MTNYPLFCSLLLLSLFLPLSTSRSGIDLDEICSNFTCLLSQGYSSAIVRALKSSGESDENAFTNILNAKKAGFLSVDVYIYPCRGKDAVAQVDMIEMNSLFTASLDMFYTRPFNDFLKFKRMRELLAFNDTFFLMSEMFKMVWVSIDANPSINCSWSSYSISSNCEFLKKLVKALEAKGKKVGIYSNKDKWTQIFGNEDYCKEFVNYPVWYSHHDQDPSFNDWNMIRFGGWTKPAIKQYDRDKRVCECQINSNFF